MRFAVAVLVVLTSVAPMSAQPTLLQDVNTLYVTNGVSSEPRGMVQFGTGGIFTAETANEGRELWKTDGTSAGTVLVKDIISGSNSSNVETLGVAGGVAFLKANHHLWKSDGTSAGTVLVKSVLPSGPAAALGSKLIFSATDGNGTQPWVSDGTDAGTFRLFPNTSGNHIPGQMYVLGSKVIFSAGGSLWGTDGTVAGTVQIAAVTMSGSISQAAVSGGVLYFGGSDATNSGLWKTDGTSAGTLFVRSLTTLGSFGNTLLYMTPHNGGVLFGAGSHNSPKHLYFSDGTSAGTVLLVNGAWSNGSYDRAISIGTHALFSPDSGGLYRTDGTTAGTTLVSGSHGGRMYPGGAGRAYFYGTDNAVWATDGTLAGTVKIYEDLGNISFTPLGWLIGSTFYFAPNHPTYGVELWKSDGTAAGTVLVKNIGVETEIPSSNPTVIGVTSSTLFFSGHGGLRQTDGTTVSAKPAAMPHLTTSSLRAALGNYLYYIHNRQLWRTDGSDAGTTMVHDFATGSFADTIQSVTAHGSRLYILTGAGSSTTIWTSTGGTPSLLTTYLGVVTATAPVDVLGRAFFFGSDSGGNRYVYRTSGTSASTTVVKALGSVLTGSIVSMGAYAWWMQGNNTGVSELWRSDGTGSGTAAVASISGTSSFVLTVAGNQLFFDADTAAEGRELWRSDGTTAGTRLVEDIYPGNISSLALPSIAALGAKVVFPAYDTPNGEELWVSDGTAAGTFVLADIKAGSNSSSPTSLFATGGKVYFTAEGSLGEELWSTDGTSANTAMVSDIEAGSGSSSPSNFARIGNKLFFSAFTTTYGREPWVLALTGSQISIDDVRVDEGAGTATLTVSLSNTSASTITVNYATADGSAFAAGAEDYTATSGTLTFNPGDTTKTIVVSITNDTSFEPTEMLHVNLSAAVNATIVRGFATIAIDDNDSNADLQVMETIGANGLTRTYTVTNVGTVTATDVVLRWKFSPGTPFLATGCYGCNTPQSLAPSASVVVNAGSIYEDGVLYLASATATTSAIDLTPSSNQIASLTTILPQQQLSLSASHVLPGVSTTAYITNRRGTAETFTIASSATGVATVSTASLLVGAGSTGSFTVYGVSAGSTTITVTTGGVTSSMAIEVVGPGSTAHAPTQIRILTNRGHYIPGRFGSNNATITATVPAEAPFGPETPTGSVRFTQNGTQIAVVALTNGQAQHTVAASQSGVITYGVEYLGDSRFAGSSRTTQVTVASDGTLRLRARRVSRTDMLVTVTVRGTTTLTGTVTLSRNGVTVASGLALAPGVNSGDAEASVTLSGMATPPQALTVAYSGDGNNAARTEDIAVVFSERADVNHDGRSDLFSRFTNNGQTSYTAVHRTFADANWALHTVTDLDWVVAGRGDFDGDGDSDLLWRHGVSGAAYLWLTNGITADTFLVNAPTSLDWQIVGVADFDGDGRADIYWRNNVTGANWMYRMNGAQILASQYVLEVTDTNWKVLGVGDFDADGKADVFWRHQTNGQTFVHIMNGNQVVRATAISVVADASWIVAGIADFDGDGDADIFWRNTATGANWMYLMHDDTIQQSVGMVTAATAWSVAGVGDVDGDGRADILWRHNTTTTAFIYLMNGPMTASYPFEGQDFPSNRQLFR